MEHRHSADTKMELRHEIRIPTPDGEFPARMTATTEFIDGDCLLMIEGIACRRAE
jgi:2-iminobutanoate/2-iminopropanoate deaminase